VRRPAHGTLSTESSATASSGVDAKSTDAKTSDANDSSSSGRKSRKIADTSITNTTQTLAAKTTISQPSSAETSSVATASAVAAQTLAVSPLGTPEQLAAEQRAAETVNTLPVQLMKLVLQFGWASTARQQFDVVHGPDQKNVDALTEAVDEYAMGEAFQQQILNPMTPTAVMQVAPPHLWYGRPDRTTKVRFQQSIRALPPAVICHCTASSRYSRRRTRMLGSQGPISTASIRDVRSSTARRTI
jgi:hypothetical protein